MQRKPSFLPTRRAAASSALAALLCAGAGAAELGEPTLRSYRGQPLAADIELSALTPDELAGLQVRLASADVYRGANIGMDPALQTLRLTLVRREQRQFLHITSLRRVDADYLHLFLELSAGGRSTVRAATLWLAADPAPAAPPAAPVAPVAPLAPLAAPVRAEAPLAHLVRAHPPAPLPAPPSRLRPARQVPAAGAHVAAPAPATTTCAPRAAGEATPCAALDKKNAALNSKLQELEGKIKVLQEALQPLPGMNTSTSAAARAPVALKPKAKPPAAAAAAQKAPAAAAASSPPMALLAAAAAALLFIVALAVYLLRRRKRGAAPSEPSKYWVLLRSPFRRKKAPEAVEAVPAEPVPE
ncbi:hypothetical protein [Janthinobacterium sp.]|uniref:type IV pilus assembly protein FimV n=1 Tax=Janthinobacterium sp. TaxID=1871054 RepID=UPI00293D9B08|nr:hypothetical protein [Janthinobacterium sp.]